MVIHTSPKKINIGCYEISSGEERYMEKEELYEGGEGYMQNGKDPF